MTEQATNKTPKKLSLHKRTLEMYAAETAMAVMGMKERLHQKKLKTIESVPFLKKINDKLKAFDSKMEKKYGQVYTKLRDSAKNITRTVLAAKLFGLPGVVGMCAYKTCEKAMSLLEPAAKATARGEADGIFDYLSKNKNEAGFTMTSGALSIAMATCDVVGAPVVKGTIRMGKASLLIAPEVKALVKSTEKWMKGEETFTEVRRNAAVAGITFGTYFVSNIPITRGSGKPKSAQTEAETAEPKKEGKSYGEQAGELFAAGYGNPGGFVTVPMTEQSVAAQTQQPAAEKPEEKTKSSYMDEVRKLMADGYGNPGGFVTVPETPKPAAPEPEKGKEAVAGTVKKEEYKNEVAKLFAAGAGNPGGMITVFDIKKQKNGR